MRVLVRHIFWSALAGPFVGAVVMLGLTLAALPFFHAGTAKVLPGVESLPAMVFFMSVLAYAFGLWPCLAFGAANGLAARFLAPSMMRPVAACAGALTAIVFALILSAEQLPSPYEFIFWAVSGAAASLASASLASRRP